MMKFRVLYLFWCIPAYLLFLVVQQGLVYNGAINTYNNGESYLAEVMAFDVKQIAAQSNGYVDIKFTTNEGETINHRLSLSIQMAQYLLESQFIPIRYQKGAFLEIVMIPTYDLQKSTSLFNLAVALLGFIATVIFGTIIHRYAGKKLKTGDEEIIIERIDS